MLLDRVFHSDYTYIWFQKCCVARHIELQMRAIRQVSTTSKRLRGIKLSKTGIMKLPGQNRHLQTICFKDLVSKLFLPAAGWLLGWTPTPGLKDGRLKSNQKEQVNETEPAFRITTRPRALSALALLFDELRANSLSCYLRVCWLPLTPYRPHILHVHKGHEALPHFPSTLLTLRSTNSRPGQTEGDLKD